MNTTKWIDIMPKIINNYNNTYHSSIKIAPIKMNAFIEHEYILYKQNETKILKFDDDKNDLNIGDKVRILNNFDVFDKKTLKSKYSDEVYNVVQVLNNSLIVEYNNNQYKVKKSDVIVVDFNDSKDSKNEINNIKIAKQQHKIDKDLKKDGIDINNEIKEKRIRKPKVLFDI